LLIRFFSCGLEQNDNPGSGRGYLMTDLSTNHQFGGKTFLEGDYQSKNLQAVFAVFKLLKIFLRFQNKIFLRVSAMLSQTLVFRDDGRYWAFPL